MPHSRHLRRNRGAGRRARVSFRLGRPLGEGPLARIWWVVLFRALVSIAFGVFVVLWPRHAMLALTTAFGVYALSDGALGIVLSAWPGALRAPALSAVAGFANIAAGAAALAEPRRIAGLLVIVLGAWLAVRGLVVFGEALVDVRAQRRAPTAPEALLAPGDFGTLLDGIMSAIFGLALLIAPHIGGLALAWALGVWAMLHGVLMSGFAIGLRRIQDRGESVA